MSFMSDNCTKNILDLINYDCGLLFNKLFM